MVPTRPFPFHSHTPRITEWVSKICEVLWAWISLIRLDSPRSLGSTWRNLCSCFQFFASGFIGLKFPLYQSKHEKANVIYIPDDILNQVLRRRCGIRRGSHRGSPSHNLAYTDYCTRMLATKKIFSDSDHVPRCRKGIWWNQGFPFLSRRRTASLGERGWGCSLGDFNNGFRHHQIGAWNNVEVSGNKTREKKVFIQRVHLTGW